jgi:hypothetical protein
MGQTPPKPDIPQKGQLFRFSKGLFRFPGATYLRRILVQNYPDLETEKLTDDELESIELEFVSEDYLHEDEPELWKFIFGDTGKEIYCDWWNVEPLPAFRTT